MPVVNARQIRRIVGLSNATLPQRFLAILDRFADDPDSMEKAGIAYATDQIIDMVANGVNRIHLYTMNRPGWRRRSLPTWAPSCAMDAKSRILRDAARYLGIRGEPAGEALAVLEAACPLAREAAQPRSLIRRAPMRACEAGLPSRMRWQSPRWTCAVCSQGRRRDWRWRSHWAHRWTR